MVRIVDANIQHAIAFAKLMVKVVGVDRLMSKVWGASIGHVEYTLHPLKTNMEANKQFGNWEDFHFWKGENLTVGRIPVNLFALSWFPILVYFCSSRLERICILFGNLADKFWMVLSESCGFIKTHHHSTLGDFTPCKNDARSFLCFQIHIPELAQFVAIPIMLKMDIQHNHVLM